MTPSATIRAKLLSSRLASDENIVGCSEGEILQFEAESHFQLPIAYREFLIACGHGAGEFMMGTDWMIPELLGIQASARSLMQRNIPSLELPDNAFVFAMHQGYQFLFLHCGTEKDPAVFHFLQSDTAPFEVSPTFTSWLQGCVQDEVEACEG